MAKDGYKKSYNFLKSRFTTNKIITIEELAKAAGYKLSSTKDWIHS